MTDIDYAILWWIQEHIVCDWLTPLMKFLSTANNHGTIWILIALLLFCFKKTRYLGITVGIALIVVTLLNNQIIKPLVLRPRPFTGAEINLLIPAPPDTSFPSGHTASSFAAAMTIFLKEKKLGAMAFALAALIAFSRLYFFVHFPSDVFAGMLEGILVAVLITALADYFKKKVPSISGKL